MSLIEFLDNAELQIETDGQKAELTRALCDLAELPVATLAKKLYADYEGQPNQWNALMILRSYFCSSNSPSMKEELFLQDLQTVEVRSRFQSWAKLMTGNCFHHSGRPAAGTAFGKNYCQKCIAGINGAVAAVDKHVDPKACFVIFKGGDTWEPITGTGCAHWVAHQQGITKGEACLDGKTLKVSDLVSGMTEISRDKVAVNDIWANLVAPAHCGLVMKVETLPPKPGSPPNRVTIRHDSSGQGGVFDNDFDSYFKAKGTFNR